MAPRLSRLAQVLGLVVLMSALASCAAVGRPTSETGAPQAGQVTVEVRGYEVRPDTHTVPAGSVTFTVVNVDVLTHEMLVVPFRGVKPESGAKVVAKAADKLLTEQLVASMVFDKTTLRLDEEHLGSLGEVTDLAGGKTNTVALDLKPGSYLLLCNLPAHFQSGMWSILTVTP
jgi:uncharacterized cupredoxin-like copper-binding protein